MHKLQHFLSLTTFYFATESNDIIGKNINRSLYPLVWEARDGRGDEGELGGELNRSLRPFKSKKQ